MVRVHSQCPIEDIRWIVNPKMANKGHEYFDKVLVAFCFLRKSKGFHFEK